ncbi:DUF6000 family protein [Streptomyces sp. NPDC047130]|uniref:DUF6000 family protein n=1 Tax=Streptomyces sp. NPDC047130 TaxID=3155261 RepID=UPI0034071E1A
MPFSSCAAVARGKGSKPPAAGGGFPAIGALLLLDARLGAGRAAQFLTPEGLWQGWIDGPPSKSHGAPGHYREFIGQLCGFVDEGARHCVARR